MKALVFDIKPNSLYSIRIPFTWQSALTYPILPPSAVIGIFANALQRYKNDRHPLEYLDLVENDLLWAGSRLLTPCVIKSYTTSAIVKWEDKLPGKFTNALGRQFAYSRKLQILGIFRSDTLINDIVQALKTSPLTCGDSESPISLDSEVMIKNVIESPGEEVITTEFPIPFNKGTKIEGGEGKIYLMHERCKKEKEFPLKSYLVPLREEGKVIKPSSVKIRKGIEEVLLEVQEIGYIVVSKSEPRIVRGRKKQIW